MKWLPIVFTALLPTLAAAQTTTDFEKRLGTVGAHAAPIAAAQKIAVDGRVDDADGMLVDLTKKDPSPEVALVVANMLYSVDPALSYDLHQRAYTAMPGERTTMLEWAMELHRRGKYDKAIPVYRAFFASDPEEKPTGALLADCLIHTGQYKDAVAAWESADHPNHHTGIDFQICAVHGDLGPIRRRADLLKQLTAGDLSAAEKLVDLDLRSDDDWWTSAVNPTWLTADVPVVGKALAGDRKRFTQIRTWVTIESVEQPPPDNIREELTRAKLLIDGGELPVSSLVARRLISAAVVAGVVNKPEMYARFSDDLWARAKGGTPDPDAMTLLAVLSYDGGDKSTAARSVACDEYAWDHYHDARGAASVLAAMSDGHKLNPDSPELIRATKEFPDDALIAEIVVRSAGRTKLTADQIAAAIAAEFHHLSAGIGGYPDSYKLKAYFALLKTKI